MTLTLKKLGVRVKHVFVPKAKVKSISIALQIAKPYLTPETQLVEPKMIRHTGCAGSEFGSIVPLFDATF